jgi:hypothetical protein
MRFFSTLFLVFTFSASLIGQTTVDFESFGLAEGEFLNDSGNSGGFSVGNVFLPNSYNPDFNAWSGWAISATTDTQTPGFTNDLSAYTGGGCEGSTTYGVSFAGGTGAVMELTGEAAGGLVEGFYITNGTYAALSMLNGDGFAKKFGGETGDDPDFFLLTVKKYLDGVLSTDSVDFYLADYRFEDNSQDYILDEWAYVDLTSLGNADSLLFTLSSTDNGDFGMNTPAYFCIDNLTTADMVNSTSELPVGSASIFPNPATDAWQVDWQLPGAAEAQLFDMQGRLLYASRFVNGANHLEAATLPKGMYLLKLHNESGYLLKRLVKQ